MTSVEAKPISELTLVRQHYPEKHGCILRIHPVWEHHFRVNYHSISAANAIEESHFVKVVGDRVAELN